MKTTINFLIYSVAFFTFGFSKKFGIVNLEQIVFHASFGLEGNYTAEKHSLHAHVHTLEYCYRSSH